MTELTRSQLRRLIDVADELLAAEAPEQLRQTVLAGLAALVGSDAAWWHELDVRPPVSEFIVGWPAERFTIALAQRTAPVLWTHPLIKVQRDWNAKGMKPPPIGRLSQYVSRRQWRDTALWSEALRDVDDQLLLITSSRGPVIQFVSVERQGRAFSDREQELLGTAARQLRAAVRRTRSGPHLALQTSPRPLWATLDPRTAPPRGTTADQQALTARQLQVLHLVREGLTDAQIGHRLGIATRTVSKHLQRSYLTLGVGGRTAAINHLRAQPR